MTRKRKNFSKSWKGWKSSIPALKDDQAATNENALNLGF